MFKIDTTDATVIEPARPTAGTPKFFSAAAKTIVTDWWLNMMQNEIYNTLLRFGITPSKTNDQQLADAIEAAVSLSSKNAIAIIREEQSNNVYCDGSSVDVGGDTWRYNYDSAWYTQSEIIQGGTASASFTWFQRNLNTISVNQNTIVEDLTSRAFRLIAGTYRLFGTVAAQDCNNIIVALKQGTGLGTRVQRIQVLSRSDNKEGPVPFEFLLSVAGTASERTYSIEQGSTNSDKNRNYGGPENTSPENEVYASLTIQKLT